jgi:hypothetical protein
MYNIIDKTILSISFPMLISLDLFLHRIEIKLLITLDISIHWYTVVRKKNDGAIMNGQSWDRGNICHKTQNEDKAKAKTQNK